MTLTDDDLKQFKKSTGVRYGEAYDVFRFKSGQLQALLTRLEAAEKIVEDTKLGHGNCICTHCAGNYEAWRKAAGK